jgi:uncharacterized membrane protein
MVSLVPATTVWMAATRLAAAPVFVYAFVFVMVEFAYIAFEHTAFMQAKEEDLPPARRKIARLRSYLALVLFTLAAAISFRSPRSGPALVCCVLLIYLSPRQPVDVFGLAGTVHGSIQECVDTCYPIERCGTIP